MQIETSLLNELPDSATETDRLPPIERGPLRSALHRRRVVPEIEIRGDQRTEAAATQRPHTSPRSTNVCPTAVDIPSPHLR
jgi:hypothetical protein